MAASTLTIQVRADNIVFIKSDDTSPATLADWEKRLSARMDSYTEPHKHLYDMRHFPSISIDAVRTGIRLRKHKNANMVYTAVLVSNSTVTALVKATLSISAGGNFKIFLDDVEAVKWLHQQVPD
jgi:hypothetical protein